MSEMKKKMKKRKKPKFPRQYAHRKKKVSVKTWRKPRGKYSKQHMKIKGKGARPTPGFSQPRKIRGLHPSGYAEVIVRNIEELKGVDPKKQAVRIASSVGKLKRKKIIDEARKEGLKILNPK